MSTETVSLTEMRPRLSELLARAREHFDRFVITRRGRAEAVLLSADEFDGLLETLEILSDKALVKRLVGRMTSCRAAGATASRSTPGGSPVVVLRLSSLAEELPSGLSRSDRRCSSGSIVRSIASWPTPPSQSRWLVR